jgi:hypothetical protein
MPNLKVFYETYMCTLYNDYIAVFVRDFVNVFTRKEKMLFN